MMSVFELGSSDVTSDHSANSVKKYQTYLVI